MIASAFNSPEYLDTTNSRIRTWNYKKIRELLIHAKFVPNTRTVYLYTASPLSQLITKNQSMDYFHTTCKKTKTRSNKEKNKFEFTKENRKFKQ